MKFKAGDLVKVVKDACFSQNNGCIFKITGVQNSESEHPYYSKLVSGENAQTICDTGFQRFNDDEIVLISKGNRKMKVGDKVTCLQDDGNCEKGKIYTLSKIDSDGTCKVEDDEDCLWVSLSNFEIAIKDLDHLQEGDTLIDVDSWVGKEYTVIQVTGKIIFVAADENGDTEFYSVEELKKNNWALKEKVEVKEMTVEEISEALGHEVKVVKK